MSRTESREFRTDAAARAERDALLAAIVRTANDAIIAMDAAGTVISWNEGARLHFGYSESEMIGLPVARFIPPDRTREQETALARIFAGDMVPSFHSVRTARSGEDLAVSVAMSPVIDEAGIIVAASAIIRPRPAQRRRPTTATQTDLWAHLDAAPDASPDAALRRKILVVEDEALVGLGLASMLENAGFDVAGPVGDLHLAMALLDKHELALVILDINLARGETSAPLAERLKRDGIPFFVISGNEIAKREAIFGESKNLIKPVGARRLVAAVHEMLD